jgi:hypothetical protein
MGRSKRSFAGLLVLGALWLPLSAYAEPEPEAAPPPAEPEATAPPAQWTRRRGLRPKSSTKP